ncbi:MAG TPA: NAD-binding protein [Halanaerobiales bacterium]|nr:NAD-binding protein [Halanaerobiales bacterium]
MYIIIAGGGIVGRNLTKMLVKDHDVVVIDQDKRICERLYSEYGVLTINGDATKIETLKEAGIDRCDIGVAAMRYDSDNLVFALMANNYGANKILTRMREPEYESAYELAGVTKIGSAIDIMVNEFYIEIEEPEIRRVASISNGKAEISIITIPEDSKIKGKTISDIVQNPSFPDDCIIAGIFDIKEDELIIPRGNQRIYAKNQVFLVASEDNIIQAASFLKS